MTKRTKSLLIAFGTMAVCGSLIAGSTYALFTASDSVNIAVTSGKVEVSAEIKDLQVYSAVAQGKLQEEQKVEENKIDATTLSKFADIYYYVEQDTTFINGGTATVSGDTLSLEKVTPGDKVTFNINVTNSSNVSIQYRTIIECEGDPYLFAELGFDVGSESFNKTIYYVSDWTTPAQTQDSISVTVSLPLDAGDSFQNRSTTIRYTVEAVQSNASTTNPDTSSTKVEFIDGVEGMVKVENSSNFLVSIPNVIDEEKGLVFTDGKFTVAVPATAISTTAPYLTFSMVEDSQSDDTYDIDLIGLKENNTEKVSISYNVGKGLKGVTVKHDEEKLESSYDAETGYVTFETSQFGSFTIQAASLAFALYDDGSAYYVSGIGTCEDTDIIIPSSYNGKSVTGIGEGAFNNNTNIQSVTIPNSVTSIEKNAFYGCSKIKSVTFADNSQLTSIGEGAFSYNSSLANISLPNSVTSMGDYEFNYCTALTSITIPAGVTSIGYSLFNQCTALQSVVLHGSVTVIDDMAFSNCTALNSVTVSGTDAVTGKVILPSGLTRVGNWAFQGCEKLTDITVPDSVTSIGRGAFAYDTSLQSITIPFVGGSKTENTFLDYIFGGNYSIISGWNYWNIPSTLSKVVITGGTIGENAFLQCSGVTELQLGSGVTSIAQGAISGCTSLQSITIPFVGGSESSNTFFGYIFGASDVYGNDGQDTHIPTSLTTVVVAGGTSIATSAFAYCSNLQSVTMSNTITSLGDCVFAGCKNLTSVTLSENITTISSYAFRSCIRLTSITIPSSVTTIEGDSSGAFSTCEALTTIVFKARTSELTIGTYAFYKCSSLQNVYYCGTEDKRKSYIDSTSLRNSTMINNISITWYYYSETETNTGDN